MKPFYIETDEEVTSVIDRLRNSDQAENIFVVPGAAILLQSVVNVRLLLQEAQRQEKAISIVTADEHAQKLVQKVGIPVYSSLDEVTGVELDLSQPESSAAQQIGTTQYFDAQTGVLPVQTEASPTQEFAQNMPTAQIAEHPAQSPQSAQIVQPQVAPIQIAQPTDAIINPQVVQPTVQSVQIDVVAPVYDLAMDVVPTKTTLREDMDAIIKETGIVSNVPSVPNSNSGASMDMRPPTAQPVSSQIQSAQNQIQSTQTTNPVQSAQTAQSLSAPAAQLQSQSQSQLQSQSQSQPQIQPQPQVQPQSTAPQSAQSQPTKVQRPASQEIGNSSYHAQLTPHKEREVKAFFDSKSSHKSASSQSNQPITAYAHIDDELESGRTPIRWAFWLVGVVVLGVVLGVSFFAFLPRAEVVLTLVTQNEEKTVDIVADSARSDVDAGAKKIPLIAVDTTIEETVVVDATGSSSAGSFKSRGKLTISNNFSAKSQPLVATTRFVTSEGVLFRLVKRVIVPGMKKVDGKLVAGTIEADVVADKPGDKYNIESGEFTIPGFKGTAKYAKFSAKSTKPMMGGSTQGGTKKVVTEEDLENAKKQAEQKVREKIIEKLRAAAAAQGRTVLDDGVEITIDSSGSPVTAGVGATSFDYTVTATAKGLAFAANDVRKVLASVMGYDEADGLERIDVSYSPSLADFDKQTLLIKAKGTLAYTKEIDKNAVIEALAGKSGEDINVTFAQFDSIQSVETSYQPGFLTGRFPWYKGSISVEIAQ